MKNTEKEQELERLHALCLERISFFMRELQNAGYFPYITTELECFFEDGKGSAVHVDRQMVQDALKESCPHLLYFGNDIKQLNVDKQKSSKVGMVVGGDKKGLANRVISVMGLSNRVVPYFARQYEAEFAPDPDALKKAMEEKNGEHLKLEKVAEQLPGMLSEMSIMKKALTARCEALGFAKVNMDAKPYPHTMGWYVAPSLHVNVSLWRKDSGKTVNAFSGMQMPGKPPSWLGKYEPAMSAPPQLAYDCVRTLVALQKDSMALMSGRRDMNYDLRHSTGYMVPKWIEAAYRKDNDYTVCYRHKDNVPMASRIENRAPAANTDPYLAIMLTLGSMYAAVCKRDLASWVEQSEHQPEDTVTYEKTRMRKSDPVRQVLGETLHDAACEYCDINPVQRKARTK